MEASTALTVIAEAIAPYIGRTMAQSSIDIHSKNVGITDGSIDDRQLDELLRRLGLGLNIFIGRDKTTALVDEIRLNMKGLR
jgi:hypothetical protein